MTLPPVPVLQSVLAQAAAQASPPDAAHVALPWWITAVSGLSLTTIAGLLVGAVVYKTKVDKIIKVVGVDEDEHLGNRVAKVEAVLYGDERTDPGIVKRVHDVESGLSSDRADFAVFTARLTATLERLEEKIDRLAATTGEHDLVPPDPPRQPLPRVSTSPRIDVSKLRGGGK